MTNSTSGYTPSSTHGSVSVSTELPVSAQIVTELAAKPALLRYVLWPLITFPDLPEHYDVEHGVTVRLRLLGILPLWRHTIRVVHIDRSNHFAVTEEHGGPIRLWRHRLIAETLAEGRCRYTDDVEIDAGALTALTRTVACGLYTYRHRRWAALAEVLA